MSDFLLDCKGQQCPKPIIQISKQMATMQPGDRLRVEATDPAFRADVTAWTQMRRECLEDFQSEGDRSIAILKKQ